MLKSRTCLSCDNTGITPRGFCYDCKGKGYVEVVQHSEALSQQGKPDIIMLLIAISKNTTHEQYHQIIQDYLEKTC
ncbi:hypothetical protein ACFX4N_24260 [Priestia sp. YIM B13551]|uniref:hypothetical protein n=1 Tax=Priestia sp. YIM B13551 TaxID=3366306 RepID=UPI00366BBEFE